VFLEGVRAALCADPAWNGLSFDDKPERGLGRVYAGWALSQPFYRDRLWTQLGYSSVEDWCVFRRSVTDRFGIVTAEFGSVTDDFGDVTGGRLVAV
jgi:hypothetical protein